MVDDSGQRLNELNRMKLIKFYMKYIDMLLTAFAIIFANASNHKYTLKKMLKITFNYKISCKKILIEKIKS